MFTWPLCGLHFNLTNHCFWCYICYEIVSFNFEYIFIKILLMNKTQSLKVHLLCLSVLSYFCAWSLWMVCSTFCGVAVLDPCEWYASLFVVLLCLVPVNGMLHFFLVFQWLKVRSFSFLMFFYTTKCLLPLYTIFFVYYQLIFLFKE